jgi:hypothetical protein
VAGVVGAAAAIVFGLISLLAGRKSIPSTASGVRGKSAPRRGEPQRQVGVHVSSYRDAETFRGTRQGNSGKASFGYICALISAWIVAAIFPIANILGIIPSIRSQMGGDAPQPAVISIGLLLACSSWAFLTLDFRIRIGLNAKLIIDSDSVIFIGKRGGSGSREKFRIRKNEVSNFSIITWGADGRRWLAAAPLPGSPLVFRGPSSRFYDSNSGLILICDLADFGIQEYVIAGALKYWGLTSLRHPGRVVRDVCDY